MTDQAPAVYKPQLRTGAPVAALVPVTLDEAYRLADAMSRSGLTPNGIKTPEAVMVAIMAGAELGIPPFQACQSFAIINGRPSIWGDAIPALLWSNGFKIKEWLEHDAPDYPDDMIAKCEITRPDGEIIAGEFSVADAKKGRLWSKDGPWQTAPKRMLKMRARSFAARDGAADLLRGLFVAEEAQDIAPAAEPNAGTGMVERLAARAVDVDAPGFNVRSITEATAPSLDVILDGDDIPAEPDKPKRPRRTKAEMEAARAATEAQLAAGGPVVVPDGVSIVGGKGVVLDEAEAIARETQSGGERVDSAGGDDEQSSAAYEDTQGASNRDLSAEGESSQPGASQGNPAESEQTGPHTSDPATTEGEPESLEAHSWSPSSEEQFADDGTSEDDPAPLTADETAYNDALAAAKVMKDVQIALQLIRQSETWVNLTADEQRGHQRAAWVTLDNLHALDKGIPTIEQSMWRFSNWLSAGAPGGEIEERYLILQRSEMYKRSTAGQREAIHSAVMGMLGR